MFKLDTLPNMDHEDDEDVPCNISALREQAKRKVQKIIAISKNKEHTRLLVEQTSLNRGMSSHTSSRVSIRSVESGSEQG